MVIEYIRNRADQRFPVVTVGDSFSQQKIAGYQNYLAHKLGYRILNINYSLKSPEQNAIDLINSGFLKRKGTKVLIVETAERAFFRRVKVLDFNIRDYSKDSFYTSEICKIDKRTLFNRTTSWIRLSFNFQNAVKHTQLNNNFFQHKIYGSELFFYYEDLNFEKNLSDELELCHQNLYRLNSLCNRNDIKLIYVLAAIKYDIYQNHIIDPKFIKNPDLESFMKLDNAGFFLNTYNILEPYAEKKSLDIYKVNDTHWSPLGHKLVANEIYKMIQL